MLVHLYMNDFVVEKYELFFFFNLISIFELIIPARVGVVESNESIWCNIFLSTPYPSLLRTYKVNKKEI